MFFSILIKPLPCLPPLPRFFFSQMFSQLLGIKEAGFIVPYEKGWDAVRKIVKNLRFAEYNPYLATVAEIVRKNTS